MQQLHAPGPEFRFQQAVPATPNRSLEPKDSGSLCWISNYCAGAGVTRRRTWDGCLPRDVGYTSFGFPTRVERKLRLAGSLCTERRSLFAKRRYETARSDPTNKVRRLRLSGGRGCSLQAESSPLYTPLLFIFGQRRSSREPPRTPLGHTASIGHSEERFPLLPRRHVGRTPVAAARNVQNPVT
ncbi:hypothetical protein EJ03DRAFT_115424 [Teratosphaeria nubilosa]|uniref:Uncharacterized protein n=1 Tax=Teratosphaeria nubilosa TaxID=161662 RepID=A0A6G1L7S7_9PEZI|nr:hypothetical protein EJ03DRAFT_115424 [Teratosphaeria nubilosa]